MVVMSLCAECGAMLPSKNGATGRTSEYCSNACRQSAYRDRKANPRKKTKGAKVMTHEHLLSLPLPQFESWCNRILDGGARYLDSNGVRHDQVYERWFHFYHQPKPTV